MSSIRSRELKTISPTQWRPVDVIQWLRSLKMEEYSKLFAAARVDGPQLLQLNQEKLISLGIRRMGHVLRLKNAIKNLKDTNSIRTVEKTVEKKDNMFAFQSLSPETEVGIKCVLGDDISVLRLPYAKLQWSVLSSRLMSTYQRPLEIRYKDKEGDIIRLSGERHLSYALDDWKSERGSEKRPRAFKLFLNDLSR